MDRAGPVGKHIIWKFNGSPGTVQWTQSHVRLPVEPALFAFSKMAHGEELWKSVCLHAADSLMTSVNPKSTISTIENLSSVWHDFLHVVECLILVLKTFRPSFDGYYRHTVSHAHNTHTYIYMLTHATHTNVQIHTHPHAHTHTHTIFWEGRKIMQEALSVLEISCLAWD